MRAEFLGMVSHELRTPLTSIKGSTAALLGASRLFAPAETREFIRIVDGQADRMIDLIAELLDAGRIDTGTLSVSPEPSEVAALVDRARTTFLSGGARHTVTIDLPPDLPRVMADRQRVEQVLNNLLANAARQAPESSPIRIAAERDGVHVAVSVADDGRGIAPERLAQLFRKYSGAAVGERGAGTGGSGLGLAICKGLVEAHGGRIRAESGGVGLGARFTFTLPVAGEVGAGAPGPGIAPGRPAPRQGREPDRILAVDDDPQTLRHVRDTLAEAGYSPLVTGDHGALGHIIRTENPALVLLDLMLPGTDGIELMQTVPELADLPVIFISGYGRDETIARALEAGAADYIVKPFSPTELTARIRAVLRRRADPQPFLLGDLAIDYDRRQVTVAGRPVALTATEYELLRVLSLNAGRVTTSETLLNRVWAGRGQRRHQGRARLRQAAPPEARRRRGEPGLDLQRPRRRLPHAPTRRPGRALTRAPAVEIDPLVERLRDPHRVAHAEAEPARGLLLQRRRGEGRGGAPPHRPALDRDRRERALADAPGGRLRRLPRRQPAAVDRRPVQPAQPGREPRPGRRRGHRLHGPVFLRNEGLDLGLARADEAQRHRLHPPGRPAARRLAPHQRRQPVADQVVERTARLLRLHQVHVQAARARHRRAHPLGRDLAEGDPLDRLVSERILLPQPGQHLPGDRLALAVRVGGEDQPLGIAERRPDRSQRPRRAPPRGLVHHREAVVGRHRARLRRQVPHMAVAGKHPPAAPEKPLDRPRLGRDSTTTSHRASPRPRAARCP